MAVIKKLPSLVIIDGFKGKLDFYVHNGVPCVRRWPRSPGKRRSPSVEAQWPAFTFAAANWNALSPEVQAAYNETASETNMSGRDLFTKGFITDYFRIGQWPEVEKIMKARAWLSTPQTIPNTTHVKVNLDSKTYDPDNDFNTTLARYVAPSKGYYLVIGSVCWNPVTADRPYEAQIRKNGSQNTLATPHSAQPNGWIRQGVCDIIHLEASDYIELWAWHDSGRNIDAKAEEKATFLAIAKLP